MLVPVHEPIIPRANLRQVVGQGGAALRRDLDDARLGEAAVHRIGGTQQLERGAHARGRHVVRFDLGRADTCALWFFQQFGMDYAVIRYYGNTGYDFTHYIEEIREMKYRILIA